MATGSGLDAQLGFGEESTWGTPVTVTRFTEFSDESLEMEPTWLEPTGLRAGQKFKRVNRVRRSRKNVSGEVNLEHATLGMGLLWKHALGSPAVPTQIATTTAYEQIHTPGDFRGLGLTVQVGRPEPSTGTVRPHTYSGCKVTEWEFSLESDEIPMLNLTLDGRDETLATALATASYIAGSQIFDFSQATLKLGGTPATASGETTITGGVAVGTIVNSISISGEAPKADERYGVGNQGLKAEQLENDTPTITGELSAEFSKTELYDVFDTRTTTALELTFTGAAIGASGEFDTLSFILPSVKLKSASPTVEGPDIVSMDTEFEAYSNEADPVIQVKIVSADTTL